MTEMTTERTQVPWAALRLATGLSQKEVERRLGWKSGHLSWIERGIRPSAEKAEQLRTLYASLLLERP